MPPGLTPYLLPLGPLEATGRRPVPGHPGSKVTFLVVLWGSSNRVIPGRWLIKTEFLSQIFRGWKSKIWVPACLGDGPSRGCSLLASYCVFTWWEGGNRDLCGPFYKGTNPIHDLVTLNSFTSQYHTSGLRPQHMSWRGTNIQITAPPQGSQMGMRLGLRAEGPRLWPSTLCACPDLQREHSCVLRMSLWT